MRSDPVVFKRERYKRITLDFALFFVPAMFLLMALSPFFYLNTGNTLELEVVAFSGLIFSPMFFLGRMYVGDIKVDADGMSWWVWGKSWRSIRWNGIKSVIVTTIAAYNEIPRTKTSYCLCTTDKTNLLCTLRYGMRFDDSIPKSEELIRLVNQYVQQFGIVVLDRRRKPEVRCSSL